ncbi:thioredoxin family protein, partial [Gemmiger formicilis]|uniref:thioredoxin family protein n=1 Tax=Gemmiger formicilis TaxID=745368 RepID=UPI0031F688EB
MHRRQFRQQFAALGGGCANCHALEDAAKAALGELGLPQEVGHITDFAQIA